MFALCFGPISIARDIAFEWFLADGLVVDPGCAFVVFTGDAVIFHIVLLGVVRLRGGLRNCDRLLRWR